MKARRGGAGDPDQPGHLREDACPPTWILAVRRPKAKVFARLEIPQSLDTPSREGSLRSRPSRVGRTGPLGSPGMRGEGGRMSTDPTAGGAVNRAPCPAYRSTSVSIPRTCSTPSNIRARGSTIRPSSVPHRGPRPTGAIVLRSSRPGAHLHHLPPSRRGAPRLRHPPPRAGAPRLTPRAPSHDRGSPAIRHPSLRVTRLRLEVLSMGDGNGTEVQRPPRQVGDGNRAAPTEVTAVVRGSRPAVRAARLGTGGGVEASSASTPPGRCGVVSRTASRRCWAARAPERHRCLPLPPPGSARATV